MSNVQNGKAFEYAIAIEYQSFVRNVGLKADLVDDIGYRTAKRYYEMFDMKERARYILASRSSIATMIRLETGFISPRDDSDTLKIRIATDREGELGDVRDVIFSRPVSGWELGVSAKNNNDAVKHSRLSPYIDFGETWLGYNVSDAYWDEIRPVFTYLDELKNSGARWKDIEDSKPADVYIPVLDAFKREVCRLCGEHGDVPMRLVRYLLGNYPFYKIIKDDSANMVIIKAFNIWNGLNKTVNGMKPQYRTRELLLPTRIIEFDYKTMGNGQRSGNTLNMVLDRGWEISFRLHSASEYVEPSLKFDIQMIGIPSVIFTQHIFQDPTEE